MVEYELIVQCYRREKLGREGFGASRLSPISPWKAQVDGWIELISADGDIFDD